MEHLDDNTALILHQRAPDPCPLREWVAPEGVDEEQKEKLRRIGQVRMNERALLLCAVHWASGFNTAMLTVCTQGDEVEKWKRMFRVVFPGLEDMPNHLIHETAYFTAIDPALGALPQADQTNQAAEAMAVATIAATE